jgi:FtsP/CotA-like multicopper oxidase with cupredoxin domain
VIDAELEPDETVNAQVQGRQLLAYVKVGPARPGAEAASVAEALIASARANFPAGIRNRLVADLQDGLKLTAFVPHPDVAADAVTGRQTLGFRILNATDVGPPRPQFEVGEIGRDFAGNLVLMNSAPYDPDRIDRTLLLGSTDEWTLTSFFVNHPFHIHVNPFQIVDIRQRDPNARCPNGVPDPSCTVPSIVPNNPATWVDVSGPGDPNVEQYANLKGVWRDTILVVQGYVVRFRTRYERYIGDYVLHCHILDHEDQGMMQNVRIAIADGDGGVAAAHH